MFKAYIMTAQQQAMAEQRARDPASTQFWVRVMGIGCVKMIGEGGSPGMAAGEARWVGRPLPGSGFGRC